MFLHKSLQLSRCFKQCIGSVSFWVIALSDPYHDMDSVTDPVTDPGRKQLNVFETQVLTVWYSPQGLGLVHALPWLPVLLPVLSQGPSRLWPPLLQVQGRNLNPVSLSPIHDRVVRLWNSVPNKSVFSSWDQEKNSIHHSI